MVESTCYQGHIYPLTDIDRWARKIRKNLTFALLGIKFSATFVQVSAIAPAISVIGGKWIASGAADFRLGIKQNIERIKSFSPYMAQRDRTYMLDISRISKQLSSPFASKKDRILLKALMPMMMMDLFVAGAVWKGAYNKAMSGQAEGYNATHKEATKFADTMVRLTQGDGRISSISSLERQPGLAQMITVFYTFFNAQYNLYRLMFRTNIAQKRRLGKPVDYMTFMRHSFYMIMMVPMIEALMLNRIDWDPEEDDLEGYTKHIASQMAMFTMLYAAGLVPLVRDVVRSIATGYEASFSPAVDMMEALTKSFGGTYDYVFDDKEWTSGMTKGYFKGFGVFLGIPIAQPMITFEAMWDKMQGEDISIVDFVLHRSRGGFFEDGKKK